MERTQEAKQLLNLLREQSCWANVCTEPGMIAFMAARAASLMDEPPLHIEVHLSSGILKNALSAGLPHTSLRGPHIAAAAGAVSRQPEKGLTILGDLGRDELDKALDLVAKDSVTVKWDPNRRSVYGKCILRTQNHVAEVVVEDSHTHVMQERLDGNVLTSSGEQPEESGLSLLRKWTFDSLLDVVMSVDPSEFQWLLQGASSNYEMATEETEQGNTAQASVACLSWGENPVFEAANRTSRAIRARMSGAPWPVLTSGGSGNQGLMVSVPIMSLSRVLEVSHEKTVRALAIAHAVNILVKAYIGEVSSSCGGISAGAGLATAICWLLGRDREQMAQAATEVLASLCGMICDGAKGTCALKGSSAVLTGMISGAGLTTFGNGVKDQGIVGRSIDETLRRLEILSRQVVDRSDAVLLELAGVEKTTG